MLNKRGMGWKQLTWGGTGLNKRGGDQGLNPSGGDCGCSKGLGDLFQQSESEGGIRADLRTLYVGPALGPLTRATLFV